ncbi:MAG: YkgJ family cysteine cluster protein [Bdellovibrionota bacterium]
MTSQNLKPLVELQANTSSFFNQFHQKYQAHMQCKIQCSQCCHVDLSIFEGEAAAILEWVKNLDEEKKQTLLKTLTEPEQTTTYKKRKACVFLRDNKCSIYDARPIICRTQGVALQYKTFEDKNNTKIHVDVCPLNFTKEESFPEQKNWLDLDRLNSLQSIAENFFQKNKLENSENPLPKNAEGRVELRKLKEEIVDGLNVY